MYKVQVYTIPAYTLYRPEHVCTRCGKKGGRRSTVQVYRQEYVQYFVHVHRGGRTWCSCTGISMYEYVVREYREDYVVREYRLKYMVQIYRYRAIFMTHR